jgi:hypothetical protein
MQLVIDLGAHHLEGVIKLLEEQLIKEDSHIISVEANPITFSAALANGKIEKFRNKYIHLSSFQYVNCAAGPKTGFVSFNLSAVVTDNYKRIRQPLLRSYFSIKRYLLSRIKNIVMRHPITYTSQGSNILVLPPKRDGDHAFSYTTQVVPMFTIMDITQYMFSQFSSSDSQLDVVFKIDIEGAEFEALESFLSSICQVGLLAKINTACFYIEWHERFFDDQNAYANRKHSIINEIKGIFGPQSVKEWQ